MASRRRRCGYIETLPSGSFRPVVCSGTDLLTGRPSYLRETVTTYDEAQKTVAKLLHHVDQKQHRSFPAGRQDGLNAAHPDRMSDARCPGRPRGHESRA